jgi:hypothetical protein
MKPIYLVFSHLHKAEGKLDDRPGQTGSVFGRHRNGILSQASVGFADRYSVAMS